MTVATSDAQMLKSAIRSDVKNLARPLLLDH